MTKQYDRSAVYNMPLEEKVQKGIFIAPVLKRILDAQNVEISAVRKELAETKAQNAEIIAIMKKFVTKA
tara:strand:- start:701 stop:907 length:207 start_codon:yes stop_codon:yes gene_type:complete